jgi:hypothetical protein
MSDNTVSRRWRWIVPSMDGGAAGNAGTQIFRASSVSGADLLTREAIQNARDAFHVYAEDPKHDPRISFRFVSLADSQKAAVAAVLGLGELAERRSHLRAVDKALDPLDGAPTSLDKLTEKGVPLRLLFIEDFGGHGLYGDPKDSLKSILYRAMYVLGGGKPLGEGNSKSLGGSFGFGKSALTEASAVKAVIAHSAFEAAGADPVTERLVGFTRWGQHEVNGVGYEGRAHYAAEGTGPADNPNPPFAGADAAERALSMGFTLRDPKLVNQRGASFLIVDPVIEPADVVRATETWWWPALEDRRFRVEVLDYGSTKSLTIDPSSRKDLKPFIDAYQLATGTREVTDEDRESAPKIASVGSSGHGVGMGFVLGELTTDPEPTLSPDLSGKHPIVALMRGPRMVVQYMTGFGVRVPIRGVYVAASADDTNLRATEDPAHSEWQSAQSTGAPSDARKVAARVKAEIRKQVEEWVMKFIPPAPTSTVKLEFMSRLFGRLIPSKGIGTERPSDPVSILTIRREPIASGDGIRGVLEFSVELTQKHDKNEAEVLVEVVALIKEGEGASGDPISSTLEHLSGGKGLEARGNELILTLVKGEAGVFRATTEEFPDVWAVDLRPMVVLSGKGKGKRTGKKKAK